MLQAVDPAIPEKVLPQLQNSLCALENELNAKMVFRFAGRSKLIQAIKRVPINPVWVLINVNLPPINERAQ